MFLKNNTYLVLLSVVVHWLLVNQFRGYMPDQTTHNQGDLKIGPPGGGGDYRALLTCKRHTSRHHQHSPSTPATGLRERRNDTSRSTGRSGRQNAATRRNMRREERVTVHGPVKKQQPDRMSHGGGGGGGGTDARRRGGGSGGWRDGLPCRALCFV